MSGELVTFPGFLLQVFPREAVLGQRLASLSKGGGECKFYDLIGPLEELV